MPVLTISPYIGGKARFVRRILRHLPQLPIYCELFGGMASVLLNRPRSEIEVLNDKNPRIYALYSALQSYEEVCKLKHDLLCMPSSRFFFKQHAPSNTPLSFLYRNSHGYFRIEHTPTWSRSLIFKDSRRVPAVALELIHLRLQGVRLYNTDALNCIKEYDSPDTTFYLYPPYPISTRRGKYYEYEVNDDYHKELVDLLLQCKGAIVLSCYDSQLYDPLTKAGWLKEQFRTVCTANVVIKDGEQLGFPTKQAERIETLYIKPRGKT